MVDREGPARVRCRHDAVAPPLTRRRVSQPRGSRRWRSGGPRRPPSGSSTHRQALPGVDEHAAATHDAARRTRRERREAVEQRPQRDLGLQPGQRRAEAEVQAVAERQVPGGVAQLARSRRAARTARGRGWPRPATPSPSRRGARRRRRTRRPRRRSAAGPGRSASPSAGTPRSRRAAPRTPAAASRSRRAGSRSMASTAVVISVAVVSWPAMSSSIPIATISAVESCSPSSETSISAEISASSGSARLRLDELGEVRGQARVGLVGGGLAGVVDHRPRPRAERVLVLHRHAEQLADHRRRQRHRVVGDEVDGLVGGQPGEQRAPRSSRCAGAARRPGAP